MPTPIVRSGHSFASCKSVRSKDHIGDLGSESSRQKDETVTEKAIQEHGPFDVAWRTIDGLKIRYATNGSGGEKVVLFSPWPESIFAFAPVWAGLTKKFEVLAIDLPGFGRSEAREDLFGPQKMGEFIVKAIEAFGFTPAHAVGLDVAAPSLLFAASARPGLFSSLVVGDERLDVPPHRRGAPSSR